MQARFTVLSWLTEVSRPAIALDNSLILKMRWDALSLSIVGRVQNMMDLALAPGLEMSMTSN